MCEVKDAKIALEKAKERYNFALKNLELGREYSEDILLKTAQEAQDAWCEIKKLEINLNNATAMKTMRDLYGC